ncbi:MAG: YggS family pyridoxal phosphate-dependent enzyme [Eubacterium sp.]|jgi:pyridoxal phosphate enzyme (YggS family)|nr:YggS family pyridoxal phosphate-dependent enzyme [Eubacterium sp.]
MSEVIQDNYRAVREKINETCKRVGRKPEEVTLIAVSKTKPLSDIEKLIKIDVIEFGENKPQELRDKFDAVSTPVRFHQIGHLQTNKVKYIINKAVLIHSVDSIKLASVIEKEAEKRNIHVNVLIEVNYAGEDTKFGVSKEEVLPLVKEIAEKYRHINIRGLMTIAPFVDDPEENRPIFKGMHELLLDIKSQNIDNVDMSILSMGMTNDYVVAVEEGATMVRVGTAIFGERQYKGE